LISFEPEKTRIFKSLIQSVFKTKIYYKPQNPQEKLLTKLLTRTAFLLLFIFTGFNMYAACPASPDSVKVRPSAVRLNKDSLKQIIAKSSDSLIGKNDTLRHDTLVKIKPPEIALKSKVEFKAADSVRLEISNQKVFMYKDADVKYEDIGMKSAYLTIDFTKNEVYAKGVPDSTGKDQGIPDFAQGTLSFKSKEMRYNYTTKRGYIKTVFTKQDEGYLHGTVVKKMENDVTYVRSGAYTTCDRPEDPHYAFHFGKAKVIPGKRVITGPAFLEIAGVSTPLILPFGYFPSRSGRRSGLILPTYGESDTRGFYFQNLGYYWAMNQYMDLMVVGDIYTHGSWAVRPTFRYVKRYKYTGSVRFGYALNRIGSENDPNFQIKKDFEFHWTHTQDPKARPKSTFSANVNIVSNTYNQYNLSSSAQNYLSNTFTSSVNYATNFGGKVYLNLNFNHSQNTLSKSISIILPQVALSVNQMYPFRRKNPIGNLRWYENISFKYNLDIQNTYNTKDSLLFKGNWIDSLQNGIKHTIPLSASIRVLKFLTWTNSINLTDRMYFKTIRKYYQSEPIVVAPGDTIKPGYKTQQVSGFANAIDGNFSSSLNTRLYGMYQFKKGPILAIRHMLTPTVAFSFTPSLAGAQLGYYRYIENDTNKKNPQKYSIFEQGIYGSPNQYKAGVVSFGLSNNLEMKVRNRKDTVTGTKKIPLIDDLTLQISYDLAKDSLNWSPLQLSARSTIIKGLTVQYGAQWDMYVHDTLGRRINQTTLKAYNQLLKFNNSSMIVGFNYSLSSDKAKKKKTASTPSSSSATTATTATTQAKAEAIPDYDYYVDFDIPWSFNVSYNFNYSNTFNTSAKHNTDLITQTLGFSGQVNITPKWKITLTTGWDFSHGELSYTSIQVYRDLHCWEMSFGWIPKGGQQSWNFSINIKASILQDMKLNKKKDFRDYY
jgi:lipopolysaccharide assembly outer membrane protein LptD (OstA)